MHHVRSSVGPYLLAFGTCVAILTLRAWPRLAHPEIWAEDGYVYLPEALEAGWRSLGIPTSSFYPTLGRALTITWTRVLTPWEWPAAISVFALAIAAAIFAIPMSRAYDWLIHDIRARFMLCVMFCFLPGLNEMIGNFANLPWLFFFTVMFMGLRDPRDPLPLWAVLLSLVSIASMAQAVFAIPMFAWRLIEIVRRRQGAAHLWGTAAVIGALGVSICLLWLAREPEYPRVPDVAPWTMFRAFITTTGQSLLLLPLIGDRATIAVSGLSPPWRGAVVLVAAFTLLTTSVARHWRRANTQAVVWLTVGVILWPVVSWLMRPANIGPFLVPLDEGALRHRYAFPTAFAAVLLWMFLAQSLANRAWRVSLSLVLVVASLGLGTNRFRIEAYGAELKWERIAWFLERARATGCPNPVRGSIYPARWTFEYHDTSRRTCGVE